MIIFLNIFYSFFIVFFFIFAVFWSDCKHSLVVSLLGCVRKAVIYLGLWHTWAVFSRPLNFNRKIILDVEYCDGEKESISLFDYENMIFFNRKANTFDTKYIESLFVYTKVRVNFIHYIKNYIEKNENKKIKKIEFIEESKEIKLWQIDSNSVNFVTLSSHNL